MDQNNKSRIKLIRDPQTVAWLVVISSFILFCVLCIAGTFGTYWFLFDSPAAMTTCLTVSRGSVHVIYSDGTTSSISSNPDDNPQVACNNNAIQPTTVLQTDSSSQGYLSFVDSAASGGQIIANVFLRANSSLTFTEALRPRFDWSHQNYTVILENATGRFSVDMLANPNHVKLLISRSSLGTVQLTESGSYNIGAFDQSMALYTQSGMGLIYAVPQHAAMIGAASQGVVKSGDENVDVTPYPFAMLNLPQPGAVQKILTNSAMGQSDSSLPLLLGCTNPPPDNPSEPNGNWQVAQMDGQPALRLFRMGVGQNNKPLGHAETSCKFYFSNPIDPVEMDLTKYTSLSVQIKMKIHFQDVTTCGIRGSECPVMVRLDYYFLDAQKQPQPQVWYQGFYADRPSSDSNIQRCDNCPRDHEQINKDSWYLYDSGDLLKQLPSNQIPVALNSITIYSSGHQYDVAIADLSVLGGLPSNQGN